MHDAPHVLTTARTVLAPFDEDDAPELLHLFRDPNVRGFLLDDVLVSMAWVHDEIEASNHRFRRTGAGMWSVRRPGAPTILGFVGFREFFAPPEQQLLYGFLPSTWGQGFASEVTARVTAHAFDELGFDEITAATDAPNRGSIRVLERLGMQLVRTTVDGPSRTLLYALDREAWRRREGQQQA